MTTKTKKPTFPEIDLRTICRVPDLFAAQVYLMEPYRGEQIPWLHLGQASLEHDNNGAQYGRWTLSARLGGEDPGRGVPTDFEHDSAYACKLPLIGVSITSVRYGQPEARGFIDPTLDMNDRYNGFYVPPPGYDPRKHKDARECKDNHCLKNSVENGGGPHVIVPEGFYVPPFDRALYEAVRGKEVLINFYCPRSV